SLTMASALVLPILLGLAVDYAIQFQSLVQPFRGEDSTTRSGVDEAVARAAAEGAPTIATAALATATGFLVLLLSPVPMVRGFGILLVVGIFVALACALLAGSAALVLGDRGAGSARSDDRPSVSAGRRGRRRAGSRWGRRTGETLSASLRGAADIVGAM